VCKTKTGIKQDKFVCCFQNQWFWTGGRYTMCSLIRGYSRQFYTPSNIGQNGLKNLTFLFVTAVCFNRKSRCILYNLRFSQWFLWWLTSWSDMMWCYRVHSSKISQNCGATLKHPGLFECEDNSLKHQNYMSNNMVSHPSILVPLYVARFTTELFSGRDLRTRGTNTADTWFIRTTWYALL
jgi:hypothetical protein